MRFKDYEDYKNQKDALLKEAEDFLNAGKTEEYQSKADEVRELDAAFDTWKQEQTNLEALKGAPKAPVTDPTNRVDLGGGKQNDELEYRKQFMAYMLKGTPITMRNESATTTTTDVGAVIPNTIMNKIVEKVEQSGNILAKITRTYYKGGVTVPVSEAKPTAKWVGERETTDKQKKAVSSITFSYYKLKVQVAVSIIVDNVTMDVFEKTIAGNIAEAIIKALETAIINGSGTGQPKGILKETVPTGQNIDIAAGKSLSYADICNAEGKLPSGYDSGASWVMSKATFFSQVIGMVDANGQPVARVSAGINGKPEYRILGRQVEFSDDMPFFTGAKPSAKTVVAFIFRLQDYMLNTNMNVTVSRYTDQDTDDEVTKAIMLADGKVIDKNSLVTVTALVA